MMIINNYAQATSVIVHYFCHPAHDSFSLMERGPEGMLWTKMDRGSPLEHHKKVFLILEQMSGSITHVYDGKSFSLGNLLCRNKIG